MSENSIELLIATFANESQGRPALRPPQAHGTPAPDEGEAPA